jgi:hypothetical protein
MSIKVYTWHRRRWSLVLAGLGVSYTFVARFLDWLGYAALLKDHAPWFQAMGEILLHPPEWASLIIVVCSVIVITRYLVTRDLQSQIDLTIANDLSAFKAAADARESELRSEFRALKTSNDALRTVEISRYRLGVVKSWLESKKDVSLPRLIDQSRFFSLLAQQMPWLKEYGIDVSAICNRALEHVNILPQSAAQNEEDSQRRFALGVSAVHSRLQQLEQQLTGASQLNG